MRVGFGFDVHRLVQGRKLILGGVEIPYEYGLLGHSDADVATHALIDALLGAAGLGDIGEHFPDTDERYRNASSLELLKETMQLLKKEGLVPLNADLTIVCERPKLKPYKDQMRQRLAQALGLSPLQVNIKAKTTEGLGFTGRQEGIATYAVVLLDHAA